MVAATSQPKTLTCSSCAVSYSNAADQRLHHKTEFHRYNAKRKAAGLGPVSLASFQIIGETFEKRTTNEEESTESSNGAEINTSDREDDFDKPETTPLSVDECFFCTSTFPNRQSVLDHMKINHSFFLPYSEDLNDVDGFVDAMRSLIGLHHTCVTCERTFDDKRAVRKHMIDKGHTSIAVENMPDVWKFYVVSDAEYDFLESDSDSSSGDATEIHHASVPAKNATSSQLTLPSGVRVSHRNHREARKAKPSSALIARASSGNKVADKSRSNQGPKYVTRLAPGHVPAAFKRQAFASLVVRQRREIELAFKTNTNNNAWCKGGRIITVKCNV